MSSGHDVSEVLGKMAPKRWTILVPYCGCALVGFLIVGCQRIHPCETVSTGFGFGWSLNDFEVDDLGMRNCGVVKVRATSYKRLGEAILKGGERELMLDSQ
jgi:hypothetical protein